MYYEINVSLDGRHLFATAERSITDSHKLQMVYKVFMEKFLEEEGYKITVTKWENHGKHIDMANMNKA
jgi:hypothetical protein